MESIIKKLGKTSITVEKDYHSSEKEYNKLTIVEEEGTFKTYLSRKPVPIGTELTNREYWIPFSGVLESITFDYLKFKKDYASGKTIEDNAIITRHILNRNIERIKIALKAISEEEIDDNAIIERTIKDRNVTSNKIAKENILTEHLAKKSVITSILADYIITAIKLADNSVTTRSIADENITDIKLANNAVTTRSIAQESIIEEKFANNSVSTRSLIDKSVTKEKLAENSVTESKIADNNITNRKIANNTIDITKFDSYTRNIIESVKYIPEEFTSIKEAIFDEINKYKPIVINGDVINAADEEDITSENNLLKLKDRSSINGMGYIILRKNKSFAEQVTKENTIYEIRYNFDLNGATITIPQGCVLKFEGGKLSNGIVNGNNFYIDSPLKKIFDRIIFTGNCIKNIYELDWFVGNKNLFCDLTSAKKDSTIEVQAAFDSGVMNIHISNQFCYYISSTIVLKSWVSLVGNKISFTQFRGNEQGEPSFYTDQAITIIKVVGDSDSNNKIQNEIVLDNVHLRHYGPIEEDNYHIETPVLYITNGTGVNSQIWGVNLNVDIYVADRYIQSLNKHMFGYTGIKIYADNGFFFTYINVNGRIYGCRKGIYISNAKNNHSWITDVRLGFDSTCVWGGQIEASPVRITGSHQAVVQLTKEELDENPYFFKVPKGTSTAMVWDLGTKATVGGTTYYNVTTAFYANSSDFFDFITNSGAVTSDDNILPAGNNIYRWKSENLWKLLPLSCNMLERTFNDIIGWQKTDNIVSGISIYPSKDRGMVESIRLYDSNENYIDLTEDLITNYNKLFTLGGHIYGNADNTYIDSCGCNLRNISNGYTNFEACFLYSRNYFNNTLSRDSYFCVFLPSDLDHLNSIFIEIEYCDNTDTVLESKRFTFDNSDAIYHTTLYLRYAKLLNSNTNYTYVRLRCRDNHPKLPSTRIAKFGILNKIFSDNAITSSGGEVTGMMCLSNVKYNLRNTNNGARYVHNKYINRLIGIGTGNYNSRVLNISVYYMNLTSVYVTFVKEDSGIGVIKITNTSVSCSDKSISCKLDVHNDNYNGRYLLSLKSINPTYIYICDVFSTYSIKFISVDETHESGYFDATYYAYGYPISGTTAERPAASVVDIGFTYFDTNLGKMIVSNGTAWVNMDGSELI